MRASDCCNLAIELADGQPNGATLSGDGGIGARSFAIERQDAVSKVFFQHFLDGCAKHGAAATSGKNSHATSQFSFTYRREVNA